MFIYIKSRGILRLGQIGLSSRTLVFIMTVAIINLGWLVGCFGLHGPLRQYFSLYRAVSQREGVVGWCDGAG